MNAERTKGVIRERLLNPRIAQVEEPFLNGVANLSYLYLHPDVATLLAVVSSGVAFYAYTQAHSNPLFYLVACLGIGSHYLFDGIDGKIAKKRGLNRRFGWHIDKSADFVASFLFICGFFWAVTESLPVTALHLSMFVGFYFWLMRYSSRKNLDVTVGGTESRLALVGLNIFFFAMAGGLTYGLSVSALFF
jgi:phosphatidylglycerophosphate synthase